MIAKSKQTQLDVTRQEQQMRVAENDSLMLHMEVQRVTSALSYLSLCLLSVSLFSLICLSFSCFVPPLFRFSLPSPPFSLICLPLLSLLLAPPCYASLFFSYSLPLSFSLSLPLRHRILVVASAPQV